MFKGAIIGFGKIAQQGHLPAYLDPHILSRARIIAVAEPNPEYQSRAQALLPDLHLYDSVEGLLENERLDFVDICTPPSFHAGAIALCAHRGLHILCEKPFALSLDEAACSRDLLLKHKTVFMACHQYRYSPIWKYFKETIQSNRSRWLLQFNVYRTAADPGFLAFNPHWRTDPTLSGGGILADTGIHYLYLASWMLGRPISLSASIGNIFHCDLKVEDTAVVSLSSERGISQITLTWGADRRANNARLVSHDCSLSYDGARLKRFIPRGCEELPVPDASDKSTYIGLYVSLLTDFMGRLENGDSGREWIDEAYGSIELLQACYHSAKNGQTEIICSDTAYAPVYARNVIASNSEGAT